MGNVPILFSGVRSSFAARLNIFKNGALQGNTAARGRSLLADFHSVTKRVGRSPSPPPPPASFPKPRQPSMTRAVWLRPRDLASARARESSFGYEVLARRSRGHSDRPNRARLDPSAELAVRARR